MYIMLSFSIFFLIKREMKKILKHCQKRNKKGEINVIIGDKKWKVEEQSKEKWKEYIKVKELEGWDS